MYVFVCSPSVTLTVTVLAPVFHVIFPPFVTLLDPAVISIAAVPDFGNAVIVFVAVVVFAVYVFVSLSNFGERVNPPILRSDSSALSTCSSVCLQPRSEPDADL